MEKIIISVSSILASSILGVFIYLNFFYINISKYQYNEMTCSVESPNKQYMVQLHTIGEEKEDDNHKNDIYYVYARLWFKPSLNASGGQDWNDKNSKIIFFERDSEGEEVKWLDNQTVVINGIKLDITKDEYDYRRK